MPTREYEKKEHQTRRGGEGRSGDASPPAVGGNRPGAEAAETGAAHRARSRGPPSKSEEKGRGGVHAHHALSMTPTPTWPIWSMSMLNCAHTPMMAPHRISESLNQRFTCFCRAQPPIMLP